MKTETLIIGGGLAGLNLASQLAEQQQDFLLVEARDRLGGRILTEHVGGGAFDLGPAWFWPGQPRMAKLVDRLGLTRFDQSYQGDLLFETEQGHVQRGQGFASMQGAYRLKGGLGALIAKLAGAIPEGRLLRSTPIIALERRPEGITAIEGNGQAILAQRVVLALPLRIADQIDFSPSLPAQAHNAMKSVATWMAGHAKVVAVYEKSFWTEAGLSGDAMSHHGPMVEIHDASPAQGGPYALFGFIGVPPRSRLDEHELRQRIQAQFVRMFGPDAADPVALLIKDWAFDPLTATSADQVPLQSHPEYGMPHALSDVWQGDLIFSGTEVAPQFGGYLEGALEAAENALTSLKHATA
ncbi:FAD-dependent oxidoreductase [Parasedimentitalea marina]|uniref:FAD-dependent oxidoreductase n=1 Tax=Parasedimentitalea marina TaxID=2483033 RepID=A0A3T0MYT8_9RHOB|nr:NAD(P)/FAD-dependent oxidoreductase [Parasedimentitalea marina]AZV76925.1 FAD-dependent oxidoreductase [Parasedimentitalea marina]